MSKKTKLVIYELNDGSRVFVENDNIKNHLYVSSNDTYVVEVLFNDITVKRLEIDYNEWKKSVE